MSQVCAKHGVCVANSNAPRRARLALPLGLAAAVTLAGCRYLADDRGIFVNPRDDYLDAEVGAPLTMPPDLDDEHIADSWPIPEVRPDDTAKNYPKAPPRPEVFVGGDIDAVKIQKLGPRSWIVLPDAPEQAWPLVKDFLAENGVAVGREDVPSGLVESAWMVIADRDYDDVVRTAIATGQREGAGGEGASGADSAAAADALPPTRYRLRFRVERGIRRGSTEVHVEHDRIVGVGNEPSPGFSQVEANVTAGLADYFAAKVAATVSMAGRAIVAESKAQIVKDADGYPSLRLSVDFDRAWATVGQALERAEIEVAEADRDAAVFRAVFPTSGKRGWLKRLIPGGERGANAAVIIRLDADSERVRIRVTAADGGPLALELAEQVLLTLREYA